MATVNDPNRSPVERASLDRAAWIEAAIDLIATEGIAGLRIETLARDKLQMKQASPAITQYVQEGSATGAAVQ